MASPVSDMGQDSHHHHHHPPPHPPPPPHPDGAESGAGAAVREAQEWIEAVTGRCFGDRDFRGALENGILLCELLSSINPGLVKKINRLPTPIAGLDNLSVFLRGCEELGLKGSQLFDPGDLQDTSTQPSARGSESSRKLKNVLITIYWLGRAANSCTSYNGPTLDLKEFEGLLAQMRKEAEDAESPNRSIRDSGYIDCWDSERSDSLSPPRHGREDSFDSLDSFGSRSRQTPSPDVLVARGSSDGRGSDSESDGPNHRKIPDLRKDDMLARRTSITEIRTVMPFNQYLPNKSNQSGYMPTPLRKKKGDKDEEGRKSWSTATSPVGGDRPFSPSSILRLETPNLTPHPSTLEPQTQIDVEHLIIKDEEAGEFSASVPCIQSHTACVRWSSDPPPTNYTQPPTETVTHQMVTSEHSTQDRSCSEELVRHLSLAATSPGKHAPPSGLNEDGVAVVPPVPDADPSEKSLCQPLTSPKRVATLSPSHASPLRAANAKDAGRRKGRALSESDDPQGGSAWMDSSLPATFSHTDCVSDDSQSMSMIDMRGEEETILPPHSQVRHELMHNQYNRMKEEDDHWQDDLARWKSRRRSISQDLIKKEEERKMMEHLMTGDTCISQRRRSIKTYRQIVEDKERREEDLRHAYRRARTPEEASAVLQRYAQRFSISEAILESLQLPKVLDRSNSADPSFPLSLTNSPTTPDPFDEDPNSPLRFLRQQSAPAPTPKFTSTLEARIEEFPKDSQHRPQIRSRSSEPPSTRTLSPKPVPLLSPKPYFESSAKVAESRANRTDGFLRVNGSTGSDDAPTTPESQGRDSPPQFQASPSHPSQGRDSPPQFQASPSYTITAGAPPSLSAAHLRHSSPSSSTGGGSPRPEVREERDGTKASPQDVRDRRGSEHSSPSRPTSLPAELQKPEESFREAVKQTTAAAPVKTHSNASVQPAPPSEAKQRERKVEPSGQINSSLIQSGVSTWPSQSVMSQTSLSSSQEFSHRRETVSTSAAPGFAGHHKPWQSAEELTNSVRSPPVTSNPKLRLEFFAPPGEAEKDPRGNVSVPVLPQTRRADRWSWDPDEERKRQERWQQEQERMLQEKYRREQEKLKEEWERAQREVAEEERKYHEEERRILEETVAPLTPRSSAQPSPSRSEFSSSSAAQPHDTIVRSLADWERKQELLERQSRGTMESLEGKKRDNDRTSDISTADDSMKTGRSLVSQSSSQPETLGHSLQNGQKPPAPMTKSSTPVKKHPDQTADNNNKPGRPAGERRSAPIDNVTSRSPSSKPPSAFPPPLPPADSLPPAPNRSVSGKKLCSSCGEPLGKGAAMIIETLSLYFHIQCFKCGVCKGQLGDTTTGTDVRIRNGLLNCQQCYIRSRSAGQPTTL